MVKTLPLHVQDIVRNKKRLRAVVPEISLEDASNRDFDDITDLAASIFDAPIALISVVDDTRQRFKASVGLAIEETPVGQSFCAHAISEPDQDVFVVKDAALDKRFCNNPLVTGDPNIRFYAGAPLVLGTEKIGTLCVIDTEPRDNVTEAQKNELQKLANIAHTIFEYRVSDRERVALELQHFSVSRRHELVLRSANIGSWLWDLETNIVDCDDAVRELFGIDHNNPISAEDILSRIEPEDLPDVRENLEAALKSEKEYRSEFRVLEKGTWLLGSGSVIARDEEGSPIAFAGVNFDISENKRSEEKTELLLRELNHRVKNTLAMLQAIASQTLKTAKSPEEFRKAFSGRIRAIAVAHTLLSDKEWEPVDLRRLIEDQVELYAENSSAQIELSGETVPLSPEESLALGLVLHELATNAAKYGALSVPGGKVTIHAARMMEEDKPFLSLEWRETGGPAVKVPDETGFGSIMIQRSLDKIVGSEVSHEFKSGGVIAKIMMPLAT